MTIQIHTEDGNLPTECQKCKNISLWKGKCLMDPCPADYKLENPEQKAKRLGLPLVPKREPIPHKPSKGEEVSDAFDAAEILYKYFNEPIKVCGECGKGITRSEDNGKANCNRGDCPCNNVHWTNSNTKTHA